MSRPRPTTGGAPRPSNTVVLLREAYLTLNDLRDAYVVLNSLVVPRLARRGHGAIRQAHGAVFQHIDDTGTTVSTLAARAQMTKQAMAELVVHLENQGYVTRTPDPGDRRAKLVIPTERGRDVVGIAQDLVPEIEAQLSRLLGADRVQSLRADLETILTTKILPG